MSSDPHVLGVYTEDRKVLEAVSPEFLMAGLKRAQEKTKAVALEICRALKPGMNEDAGRKLGLEIFADHGVKKHWHRPHVRFGPGTRLNFNHPMQLEHALGESDIYYLDLGPVWKDEETGIEYEGDFGDTYAFGNPLHPMRCIQDAHLIFSKAREEWRNRKLSGVALYQFMKESADHMGYDLLDDVAGHRVSDFPHHRFTKGQLSMVPFYPTEGLWVLEVQILDRKNPVGAFFEDIL